MFKQLYTKSVDVALSTLKFGIGTFICMEYVGGFVICTGPSMEPTIVTKDILLTEHISPRLGKIDKGDIVVARCPLDRQSICKRVAGTTGDKVNYKGKLITIPKEHVWLEGDNKFNSLDSREYGPVPISLVRRRCFGKIYPEMDFHFHENHKWNKSFASSSSSANNIINDDNNKSNKNQGFFKT